MNEEIEIWKPVIGFENTYYVSNKGNIKNIVTNKILKPQTNSSGYLHVSLYFIPGKAKHLRVHRLVAESFLGLVENENFVNHKNGNKKDNSVENLEWCSAQFNIQHAYNNGLMPSKEDKFGSKLTIEKANEIRKEKDSGLSYKVLAKKYNVSKSAIQAVVNKRTWI